jgi:hypothetical protein
MLCFVIDKKDLVIPCQQRFKIPQFQRNEIPHYERLIR